MRQFIVMSATERSYEEVTQLRVPKNEDDDHNDLPPPPDGGYGWVIVATSFLCNMVVDGISYTFGIFLPEIVKDYGETKGNVAWVGSLLTGMTMCAGPIVSALANKYGCRTVCIVGSLISTAAFALSIFSPNVIWLMLIYGFVGGTGFGLIYLPAVVCVGYYFESKRSLATGIAVCGSGVGTFAFAPLATTLLQIYGWKGANLILAGIILNCVIFGALMRPLQYPEKNKVTNNSVRATSVIILENSKLFQGPVKSASHGAIALSVNDVRNRIDSVGSITGRNLLEVESSTFTSKLSLASRKSNVIQPLARKDVFYSGSILNLKEFQSQKSLASYRQSITNMQNIRKAKDENPYVELLKDPVFMLIAISNLFGMAGLYVPFVYLVDCAVADGIDANSASFLLSIIGITNTIGRIICGYFADFPQVNALLVNNLCLVLGAVSIVFMPFCHTYMAYSIVSVLFAIAVSGYISLSSIILVDLLGLEKLTNAFGLLILFRGAAALVGSPLAGGLYDATQSYDIPFYVAGALFTVAAGISFAVPCVQICSPKGKIKQVDDETLNPINNTEKLEKQ
ncbi:monocarboxylate transporter 14 isoform X1 [Anoplophora glabripennis]|uniref:monocarboxylate transporter 14 isoform X1 n=2 Tax=Anoplophora glabripennis TaxID=217634 RepID=UPI0008751B0B|nr:monocarboxylate transporter 14 isoform X1 [Anoplophora glabripennis]